VEFIRSANTEDKYGHREKMYIFAKTIEIGAVISLLESAAGLPIVTCSFTVELAPIFGSQGR